MDNISQLDEELKMKRDKDSLQKRQFLRQIVTGNTMVAEKKRKVVQIYTSSDESSDDSSDNSSDDSSSSSELEDTGKFCKLLNVITKYKLLIIKL